MPRVLLVAGPRGIGIVGVGVGDRAVPGVPAADAGGLHAPGGGQIGGPEAHALHARARAGDLLEIGHPLSRLEHGVHEDRPLQAGLGLELGEQAIDVVDVPRALDLGDHHDLELVADVRHQFGDVVEHPWRGELVDAGPKSGFAEVHLAPDADQARARGLLFVHRHRVLEIAQQDVDLGRELGSLGDHFLVGEVHEVDHPRGLERDLARGLRRVDGQGLVEVAGAAHAHDAIDFFGRQPRASPHGAAPRRPQRALAGTARAPAKSRLWLVRRRSGC